MSENIKNKVIVDKLAKNILVNTVPALEVLLQEYIVKSRRDLLLEEKELEEEIYIAFPERGKDLKLEPDSYDVGHDFSFAFRFSGTYAQLQPCEYRYRYTGRKEAKFNGSLREQMKKIGIVHESAEANDDDITLAGPCRHKCLEFRYASIKSMPGNGAGTLGYDMSKPVKELGRGYFEVPLSVGFKLKEGDFIFNKVYLTESNGDHLTDAYNNEICVMPLEKMLAWRDNDTSPYISRIGFD